MKPFPVACRRPAMLALLLIALSGCSVLGGSQPFSIYAPRPMVAAPVDTARIDWQLLVERPRAGETVSAPTLLVMPSPGVYEVFPAARWRDPPPALVGTLLLETFEQSGRIIGVDRASSGVNTDFVLASELREFQIELVDGAARARVSLHAKLLGYADNRIVAARSFSTTAPAAAQDAASAAKAIEAALAQLLPEVRDWTFAAGEANHGTAQ